MAGQQRIDKRSMQCEKLFYKQNSNIFILDATLFFLSLLNQLDMASKVVSKLVKPPISLFGLEGRYVNALYSAASKSNKLEAVEGDLKKISKLYDTDSKFKDFMINPLVNPIQKVQVFGNELKNKLKLNDLSVNLLAAMAENRRLKNLPDVERGFAQVMAAVRGELPCLVTSAKPLSDAKKSDVLDSLKTFTSKKLTVEFKVDPSIMGGLIVDFNGEHYIDMSVRSKIRLYSDCIKSV